MNCVLARWFLDVSFQITVISERVRSFLVPKAISWQAWWLHFGTLGDHFGTLGEPWEAIEKGHPGI